MKIKCQSCHQTFEINQLKNTVFCVYCGQPHDVTGLYGMNEMCSNDHSNHSDQKDQDSVPSQSTHEQNDAVQPDWIQALTHYIRLTEPMERILYVQKPENAALKPLETVMYERYSHLGHDRRQKDKWMFFLQEIVMYATNQRANKKVPLKLKRVILNFISKSQEVEDDRWIYVEWVNLIHHYIHLCMTDKQYRSVLFGFGSKNDEDVVKKISGELADIELNILKPIESESDFIHNMRLGLRQAFKLYFDSNAVLMHESFLADHHH